MPGSEHTYTAHVVGRIWWPMGPLFSGQYTYQAEDTEHAIERVDTQAGDFSAVLDFEILRHDRCPACGGLVYHGVRDYEDQDQAALVLCGAA